MDVIPSVLWPVVISVVIIEVASDAAILDTLAVVNTVELSLVPSLVVITVVSISVVITVLASLVT